MNALVSGTTGHIEKLLVLDSLFIAECYCSILAASKQSNWSSLRRPISSSGHPTAGMMMMSPQNVPLVRKSFPTATFPIPAHDCIYMPSSGKAFMIFVKMKNQMYSGKLTEYFCLF